MIDSDPFVHPKISDDDIRWVSALLGNPKPDFFGEKGYDPRQEVLKSMETLDVAACPGSGKTTLLVAKLAILAKKWTYRTRGICVLSHTNAARHEIETRLGNTSIGRGLLTYPHFIGTIHGFVNEYLTLPMLRSRGFSGIQFSSDISGDMLWKLGNYGRKLPGYIYRKIKNKELRESAIRNAHYIGEDLDLVLEASNVNVPLRRDGKSTTFQVIDEWKQIVLKEGFVAYEDIFAYGNRILKEYPALAGIICERFPLLFIDEAQDNSESQSAILHRVFMNEDNKVIRQRFGDNNQAIYNFVGDTGATTDGFPDELSQKNLPNSHRFGQNIANLAAPLGIINYEMKGQGPKVPFGSGESEGRHTIFVFEDENISKVLDAYAELLIDTFSTQELLIGTFTAVGLVHKDKGDYKKPRHIGHYWENYDSEINRQDPQPQTFVQYILVGQGITNAGDEVYPTVEKIAEGILRLASMGKAVRISPRHRYKNRYIINLLNKHTEIKMVYEEMLHEFAVKKETLTQKAWEEIWREEVQKVSETIAGVSLSNAEAKDFLAWRGGSEGLNLPAPNKKKQKNIYHFSKDGKDVLIQVGSIHSIKGETHTATLVMETFWHKHNIEALLPWLDGRKTGAGDVGLQQRIRLKTHYVAMTRPTHLICLAMKRSTLESDKGGLDQSIQNLKENGWHNIKLI